MIHHEDTRVTLHHGDCLDVMAQLADNSVDSICTDPPYGLGFMGKAWDDLPPGEDWARECLRVLKPGGHLLAFGGTRTWHRLACAVEDAGFEVRDSLAWLYGSGFPKSLDVSKAIDKANGRQFEDRFALGRHIRAQREALGLTAAEVNAWFGYRDGCQHWERQDTSGARVPTLADWRILRDRLNLSDEHLPLVERVEAEREVIGAGKAGKTVGSHVGEEGAYGFRSDFDVTAPATDAAREWAGWGTALKPAFEPVVVARKPLVGTVAANVLTHGTGALNIDGCRIEGEPRTTHADGNRAGDRSGAASIVWGSSGAAYSGASGRWPANVVLDEEMATRLDEQSGTLTSGANPTRRGADGDRQAYGEFRGQDDANPQRGIDKGGASRFFYVAKAPKRERPVVDGVAHPTVKPLALMRWLVRLVTPPGGTVLEPFAGSGTTVEACLLEDFRCIAIEKGDEYLPLILARIARQSDPLPEAAELVRTIDEEEAILEQIAGQLDIFGEGVA